MVFAVISIAIAKFAFNYVVIKSNFAYLSVISLLSFAIYLALIWLLIIDENEKGMIKKVIAAVQGKFFNKVA